MWAATVGNKIFKLKDWALALGVLCSILALLTGCGTVDERPDIKIDTAPQPEPVVMEPSKEGFGNALKHLQYGRTGAARAELQAYLLYSPGNENAQDLLAQIDTPSSDYFPSGNFTVELKSGQSLSTLSKQYLGSAFKFYALAKYNGISNPNRVDAGQEIKIPLTEQAIANRNKATDVNAANESIESKQKNLNQTVGVGEIGTDNLSNTTAVSAEQIPESAGSLVATITALLDEGDYVMAYEKLKLLQSFGELAYSGRLLAIDTLTAYGNMMAKNDSAAASRSFADAAKLQLIEDDGFGALESLSRATELDPENNVAMEEKQMLQQELADKYHREASSAFRRQELDEAIDKWTTVLQIDPGHASARAYLAQARELQDRLKKINR